MQLVNQFPMPASAIIDLGQMADDLIDHCTIDTALETKQLEPQNGNAIDLQHTTYKIPAQPYMPL